MSTETAVAVVKWTFQPRNEKGAISGFVTPLVLIRIKGQADISLNEEAEKLNVKDVILNMAYVMQAATGNNPVAFARDITKREAGAVCLPHIKGINKDANFVFCLPKSVESKGDTSIVKNWVEVVSLSQADMLATAEQLAAACKAIEATESAIVKALKIANTSAKQINPIPTLTGDVKESTGPRAKKSGGIISIG